MLGMASRCSHSGGPQETKKVAACFRSLFGVATYNHDSTMCFYCKFQSYTLTFLDAAGLTITQPI